MLLGVLWLLARRWEPADGFLGWGGLGEDGLYRDWGCEGVLGSAGGCCGVVLGRGGGQRLRGAHPAPLGAAGPQLGAHPLAARPPQPLPGLVLGVPSASPQRPLPPALLPPPAFF